MKSLDKLFEQQTRQLAQRSSRRGMLKTLGGLLVGAGSIGGSESSAKVGMRSLI